MITLKLDNQTITVSNVGAYKIAKEVHAFYLNEIPKLQALSTNYDDPDYTISIDSIVRHIKDDRARLSDTINQKTLNNYAKPLYLSSHLLNEYLGYYNIRKPIPKLVMINKDKTLTISKISQADIWTIKEEKELQKVRAGLKLGIMLYKKDSKQKITLDHIKGIPPLNTSRIEVRRFRESRKRLRKDTYVLKRGPYQETFNTSGFDLKRLYRGFCELRKSISHDRRSRRLNFKSSEGKFGPRVALAYINPQQTLYRKNQELKKSLFKGKAPKDKTPHVGVELEFCSPFDKNKLSDILFDSGLSNFLTLKSDTSIKISKFRDYTHELCILARQDDYKSIIDRVCRILKAAGGYVNSSCGLHVHLDMRNRKPDKCYENLLRSINILYAMVPPERRFNKFCQRNPINARYSTPRPDRYWAINTQAMAKHETIEIRLHSGSLNSTKINNWISILLHIINSNVLKVYKMPRAFIKDNKFPADLSSYILKRIKHFNAEGIEEDEEHKKILSSDSVAHSCDCGSCGYRLLGSSEQYDIFEADEEGVANV